MHYDSSCSRTSTRNGELSVLYQNLWTETSSCRECTSKINQVYLTEDNTSMINQDYPLASETRWIQEITPSLMWIDSTLFQNENASNGRLCEWSYNASDMECYDPAPNTSESEHDSNTLQAYDVVNESTEDDLIDDVLLFNMINHNRNRNSRRRKTMGRPENVCTSTITIVNPSRNQLQEQNPSQTESLPKLIKNLDVKEPDGLMKNFESPDRDLQNIITNIYKHNSQNDTCEFSVLSSVDKKFIELVSRKGPPTEIIIEKFNFRIMRQDLITLTDSNWLNENVINFYMNLLTDRSKNNSDYPSVFAMDTTFIPQLLQAGYAGVRHWTQNHDIFNYSIIPIPVHVGHVHWCMAIINLAEKSIKYYDSLDIPNPALLRLLANYLKEESIEKRNTKLLLDDWTIENERNLPEQKVVSDCGVFCCMFAEYITREMPIIFAQESVPYLRQKMIYEIAKGKLLT